MKRLLALLIVVPFLLAACGGAATPAAQAPAAQATQAPAAPAQPVAAQPTQGAFPTQAPAAIQPTVNPLATALSEIKPPQSGGVLNPPTLIPTAPGNSSVTSSQPPAWITYRDQVSGLTFQYPRDWQTATSRNSKGTVTSIIVAQPVQPLTNTMAIVIDVRKKQGDLITWLSQQLPTGSLLIDVKALERSDGAKTYNARVAIRRPYSSTRLRTAGSLTWQNCTLATISIFIK
jgi:hypothetical protein